ncbi:hypothetical protein A6V25_30695 [Nostoc sp. ATCC 53789]|nr:hypothetical protein A6V25_30695 [Nostoc sp. ATCC 53789]
MFPTKKIPFVLAGAALLSFGTTLSNISSANAASLVNSAVIHIGVDDNSLFGINNIVNFLQGDGRFSSISNIDVDASGVPTLATLSGFESVLVVTDNRVGTITGGGFGTQLGNILDDYVIAGGRLVLGAFSGDAGIGIDGDILNLAPYIPQFGNAPAGNLDFSTANLSNPIFNGVNSFTSDFASIVNLSANGILLASYDSGTVGVATVANNSIIFINAFPGNESDFSNGSDFGTLFANALAAQPRDVPEPTSILGLLAMSAVATTGLGKFKKKNQV